MKWIPTSERLPSERGEYLVTVDFEGDTYVECFHYGKPIMANREVKDECFYDSDDEWGDVVYDTGIEVIAWMPLPEPYTADRKTENSSEKPNNCEVKNYCDDCLYTDTCDSKEFFYACTSKATISKMEQVDKDINVRSKDEPQTDCSWK